MQSDKFSAPFSEIINMPQDDFADTQIDSGYDSEQKKWEVIVKYNGDILKIADQLQISIEILNESYAIVFDVAEKIEALATYDEVIYIEQAKLLGIVDTNNLLSSCITPVQNNMGLTGKGTIVAILDTGVNIKLKEFLNDDGTTRVLYYWDQTLDNNPPTGFLSGTEYTRDDLNKILADNEEFVSTDFNGHGTMVASIAAGNGRTNQNVKGVATQAELIIVKLNSNRPLTTQLMRAIKYCTDKAKDFTKTFSCKHKFWYK